MLEIVGQKRGIDDYGGREDHRRRDDFLADDGRSIYTAGGPGENKF